MPTVNLKYVSLAILTGLLAALPFLNFSLSGIEWLALVPLLSALGRQRTAGGMILGFLAGLIFNLAGLYWLTNVTWLGYALLGLYLALYWAAWGGWASFVASRHPGWMWLAAASFWTAGEFGRTYLFTGFPWNLLGISQARNTILIQVASCTGVYGVSFLIVLVNGCLAHCFLSLPGKAGRGMKSPSRFVPLMVAAGLVLAILFFGKRELAKAAAEKSGRPSLALCLVQGGIRQELKWRPELAPSHFRTYLELSQEALSSRPDLIAWPESALPFYLPEQNEAQQLLGDLARAGRLYLLVGGDWRSQSVPPRYFNSAYLVSPNGAMAGRYDKIHLVPYGEYTPLKRFLPFLRRLVPWDDDFSSGKDIFLFDLALRNRFLPGEAKLGVLICYEDVFPGLVREFVRRGAGLLVNLTNDAWYGETSAPYQHAYAALFRAVENRVYLGRSTNTGYSCVIDPWGRVVGEVRGERGNLLFISGWTTVEVNPGRRGSFYLLRGDVFSWLCILLTAVTWLACARRR